jgi:hypothetical protein
MAKIIKTADNRFGLVVRSELDENKAYTVHFWDQMEHEYLPFEKVEIFDEHDPSIKDEPMVNKLLSSLNSIRRATPKKYWREWMK